MFAVNDPQVNRMETLEYDSLTEALEAINKFGPTIVTGISGTVKDASSFRYRKKFTYERGWVMFRGMRYANLRSLTERLSSHATVTRLHITFSRGPIRTIKLRLTSPMFASDLYE